MFIFSSRFHLLLILLRQSRATDSATYSRLRKESKRYSYHLQTNQRYPPAIASPSSPLSISIQILNFIGSSYFFFTLPVVRFSLYTSGGYRGCPVQAHSPHTPGPSVAARSFYFYFCSCFFCSCLFFFNGRAIMHGGKVGWGGVDNAIEKIMTCTNNTNTNDNSNTTSQSDK